MARYPGATWRPTLKHGYGAEDTHLKQGLVIHSAEGSLAGLFSVLDGSREASWHFSVAQDGHAFQHVDTENIAWTNGSKESNKRFWGIECEGVAGEPLTEPQHQALLSVVKWLWATHNPGLPKRGFTLFEHNEMTHYGSASTSCPSGRIPWERLIADMEEDMAKLDNEDKEYLAGLMRGVLWAVADGQMNSAMRMGDDTGWRPPRTLRDVMNALSGISGNGGLGEAQVRQIVRQEIDKTKLTA